VTYTAGTVLELGTAGPMRDALVASVLSGEKTVTSSLLVQYEDAGEPVPKPGARILVGSEELPVAVVEVSAVDLIRLGEADLQLALDEGEGFKSVAQWRAAHERFWAEAVRPTLRNPASLRLNEDTPIVVERFRLVESRPAPRGICRPRTPACAPACW
jgi:uncharacterized protein YhfF